MAKHAARELLNLPLDDAFQRFTSTPSASRRSREGCDAVARAVLV